MFSEFCSKDPQIFFETYSITLPRVNNSDIKQKKNMEYSFYCILQAPYKKWVNGNKTQNIPLTT